MQITHSGFEQFNQGSFDGGGHNLFVDASGVMRRFLDNDLNGDGIFDIVLPNSHGYDERAPTFIFTEKNGSWEKARLPHDSGWAAKAADIDGDGFLDLVIVNGENGVSSELPSYIYWGGPGGLTGERTVLNTSGAYDCAVWDLNGSGLKDIIFTNAWTDHHNGGVPLYQKIYRQMEPRKFLDLSEEYKIAGSAVLSLICDDLNNDGYPEIALACYREGFNYECDSLVYRGGEKGFDTAHPLRLPTCRAMQVQAEDLNGDGFKELIFSGGNKVIIYWNVHGDFSPDNALILDVPGTDSQVFYKGKLYTDFADLDGDGLKEMVIGTREGIEIRKQDSLDRVWQKIHAYSCTRLACADIYNTGWPAIIASNYATLKTYDTESLVFWNDKGKFSAENVTAFETHGPVGCIAADLDNDGKKEIIFCNTMTGPSQFDPEFPVFAYYGTKDFKYLKENRKEYPVHMGCYSYISADVDNDGYVELAAAMDDGLRIFKGTPDGPDPENYYDLIHPCNKAKKGSRMVGGVLVGDFNRDGWLDLISVPWVYTEEEAKEGSTIVYYGGPEGFSDKNSIMLPSLSFGNAVYLADINNDGYPDFIYGDPRGWLGVFYGGPGGFSGENHGILKLPLFNGAPVLGITAADVDNDGWLEIFLTTRGHTIRKKSHLFVLRDGKNGYPPEKAMVFETGGTAGFAALADMRGTGCLDLLLPFYSTEDNRELPARIFHGDGKGNFDWEHPGIIDCLSSFAFLPVDLRSTGKSDLFICCHRNNLGHIVDSMLIYNGPQGLDLDHIHYFQGYGPHNFTHQCHGNAFDRTDVEYYTSPVFHCENPVSISWDAEAPNKTSLFFQVRFGKTEEETGTAQWSGVLTEKSAPLHAPEKTEFMQYRAGFKAPAFVNSPRLKSVVLVTTDP
jgi:hypothetical protein